MPTFDRLRYEVDDGIAELTMDRPPVNAIDGRMIDELLEAYRAAGVDDEVRAIVLRSRLDRAFSAGVDLDMARGMSGPDHREFQQRLYFEHEHVHHQLGTPTVAAIEAPAVAGGVTLAIGCNCIVIDEATELGYPEIDVGHIPGSHFGPLIRLVGRHKAFELLFSGEPISGTEAERLGLANHAVPHDEVLPTARELALTFAEKPPYVMELAHNAFMQFVGDGARRELGHVRDLSDFITELDESRRARDSFFEGERKDADDLADN